MTRAVNMQRVAELAGVSKSAVSLALRDDPRLAVETRRRVQEAAARLGYRKNPIVASLMAQLRGGTADKYHANIALLNTTQNRGLWDLPSFAALREGIRERCSSSGYGIDEFWTHDPARRLPRLGQILAARNIRGAIVVAGTGGDAIFDEAPGFARELSVVSLGSGRTRPALHRAGSDCFQTARRAVEVACTLGYRRPALVVSNRVDQTQERRYSAGFLAGVRDLVEAGVSCPEPLLLDTPEPRVVTGWLRVTQPDVLITDQWHALAWVRDAGFEVPGDLGLMHLDWSPDRTEWAGMRQNHRLAGSCGAEMLIQLLTSHETGVPTHPRQIIVESEFVLGPSVVGTAGMVDPGKQGPAAVAGPLTADVS